MLKVYSLVLRLIFWCWSFTKSNRARLLTIRDQAHSYFNRWHYSTDSYLIQSTKDDGYTPISTLLTFPRMKAIEVTLEELKEALWSSHEVEWDVDGYAIKPRWSRERWSKERLVYSKMRLKNLPKEANQAEVERWLKNLKIRAYRVSLYTNSDGSRNGSGCFIAESMNKADELHERFSRQKPRWQNCDVLIERDKKHVKSPSPGASFDYEAGEVPSAPQSMDQLSFEQHRFLENCKITHFPHVWKAESALLEYKNESVAQAGPFRTSIIIKAHHDLIGVQRTMIFKSAFCSKKKESLRIAEFKAAQFLFHILCPDRQHPYPLSELSDLQPKTEIERTAAIERLSRLNEVKRLRNTFREINPHNMSYYADLPGMLVATIGQLRPFVKKEITAFDKLLSRLPLLLDLFKQYSSQRAALLNHRGYNDFVKPILASPVVAKSKKSRQKGESDSEGEDSDEGDLQKSCDIDREDDQGAVDISALEAIEFLIPASLLQIGYLESPHTMRVLWQTSTQLSIAGEEITPRLNILWTRHTIRYQFRNLIRNLSSPMWIETDLTGLEGVNGSQEEGAKDENEKSGSSSTLHHASYLDWFIPVDSVPRLSSQEHFQNHKVGSTDFTLNDDMASMTMIRIHFDLSTLKQESFVHLMVLCRSLVDIGLLRMRFDVPATRFLPLNTTVSINSIPKERTNVLVEKSAAKELPVTLVKVDHWVRWKLACLVTSNAVRLSEITEDVVALLLAYPRTIGFRVLEKMESEHRRVFYLEQRLQLELSRYPNGEHSSGALFELKKDFALVAHVTVTPWEIRCEGPLPEVSNRLLRHYEPLKERFVRLSFRSGFLGGQTGGSMRNVGKMAVRKRCGGILQNGISISALKALFEDPYRRWRDQQVASGQLDKIMEGSDYRNFSHFEYLVSSPSQLRTQKAWLYCPPYEAPMGFGLPIEIASIRKWLGEFEGIFNVAMFSARLGQGLSSTFHCFDIDPSWIRRIPDVNFKEYCFSDGCATISLSIARRAASALNLKYIPSAFQIRLAGIKGMVSIDTRLEGDVICVRPSMEKFLAPNHVAFEVVGWSRPLAAHLNKQIIQILSALGLPDQNLIDVQTAAFKRIAASTFPSAFQSEEARTKRIDDLERTWGTRVKKDSLEARAITMLRCGFNPISEPYLKSILTSIALRSLQDIHSMARIPIVNGRYTIGIMDEYGVLEEGQVYFASSSSQSSDSSQSSQLSESSSIGSMESMEVHIHTGKLCISRSPCLHPGDARFVTAVDVPELAHLKDVLVFPQKGARPIPDECSGGDLDGDQYLVLWGPEFMAPKQDTPAACELESSSSASKAGKDDNEVYPHELVDFFVNYIFDDKLSSIADAHTYWADKSDLGVFDERCLRLAAAHNIAVDAPKTGKTVPAMDELRIASWPDFMNVNKASYLSSKVLGILYRRSSAEFSSIASWASGATEDKDTSTQNGTSNRNSQKNSIRVLEDKFYDQDLIVPGSENFLEESALLRDEYFHQLCTNMQLFGVQDEGSAITGDTLYRFRSERRDWESKKEGYDFTSGDLRKRIRGVFFQYDVDKTESHLSTQEAPSASSASKGDETTIEQMQCSSSMESESPIQALPMEKSPWTLTQLQRASAWYQVTYDPKWRQKDGLTMWSFPWLIDDVLCHIKREAKSESSSQSCETIPIAPESNETTEVEKVEHLLLPSPSIQEAPIAAVASIENALMFSDGCDVAELPASISPVGV